MYSQKFRCKFDFWLTIPLKNWVAPKQTPIWFYIYDLCFVRLWKALTLKYGMWIKHRFFLTYWCIRWRQIETLCILFAKPNEKLSVLFHITSLWGEYKQYMHVRMYVCSHRGPQAELSLLFWRESFSWARVLERFITDRKLMYVCILCVLKLKLLNNNYTESFIMNATYIFIVILYILVVIPVWFLKSKLICIYFNHNSFNFAYIYSV